MSSKQCNKCGRFKGVDHSCPTMQVKSPIAPKIKPYQNNPPIVTAVSPVQAHKTTTAPTRPNLVKVQAILQDAKKLETTIKSLEFSVGINSQNPTEAQQQTRINLESTFGRIDWNA